MLTRPALLSPRLSTATGDTSNAHSSSMHYRRVYDACVDGVRRSALPSSDFGRASTVVTPSRIMDLSRGAIPMLPDYPSSQTIGTSSVCTSSLPAAAPGLPPFPATIISAPPQTVGSSYACTSSLSPAAPALPPFPATVSGAPSLPTTPFSLPVPSFMHSPLTARRLYESPALARQLGPTNPE